MNPGTCKACHTPLNAADSIGSKNGYELLPCKACGTITVAPFPSVEQLIAHYQSYKGSKIYMPKAEKKIKRSTRRISRLIPQANGRKFLDIGCNCGFTVKAALDLGLDAHGIDIDADAVEMSKSAFGPHFSALSIQDYAARGQKADIIHTSEVIEHVPDPDAFVAALKTVLNPGGVLFLTTPDPTHWRVPRDFTSWNAVIPPTHIVYFTKKGLKQLFEKYGFSDVKFRFTMKPGMRMTARRAA